MIIDFAEIASEIEGNPDPWQWKQTADELPPYGALVLARGRFYSVSYLTVWRVRANGLSRAAHGDADVWYSRGETWSIDSITEWCYIGAPATTGEGEG